MTRTTADDDDGGGLDEDATASDDDSRRCEILGLLQNPREYTVSVGYWL